MLGKVGGFLGHKCDGQPGAQTLWRGLMVLCMEEATAPISIG